MLLQVQRAKFKWHFADRFSVSRFDECGFVVVELWVFGMRIRWMRGPGVLLKAFVSVL